MRFLLLYIILFVSGFSLKAQEQTHTFTIRDTSGQIVAVGLLSEFQQKKKENQTYHYFYKGQIHQVTGSYAGYLLHGPFQRFDTLNKLVEEGNFQYGRKEGTWKSWHSNGKIKTTLSYKKGKKSGTSKSYDAQGVLILVSHFKNDLLHGKYEVYESGELVEEKLFRKGVEKVRGGEGEGEKVREREGERRRLGEGESGNDKDNLKNNVRGKKGDRKQRLGDEQMGRVGDSGRKGDLEALGKRDLVSRERRRKTQKTDVQETSTSIHKIQVFVKDKNGKALNDVSIKINKFRKGKEQYKQFGNTDAQGHYLLTRDSGDYVLYLSKSGFEQEVYRVYEYEKRTALNINLKEEILCTNWKGKVLQSSFDYTIRNATVQIQDKNGRLIKQVYTNHTGLFEFCFECGKQYELFVFKDNFSSVKEPISFNKNCTPSLNQGFRFYLSPEQLEKPPIAQQEEKINVSPKQQNLQTLSVAKKDQSFPFYVVVGSFSKKKNAEKRLKEVKALGYKQAEIIKYLDTGLFGVSIGGFKNETKANELKTDILKKDQIKSFVKKL
jgi:hypothetical protein